MRLAQAIRCRVALAALVVLGVVAAHADRGAGHGASGARPPVFDSSRAFEHIRQLVAIGPRTPGSAGSAQARAYITREIAALGLKAVEQPFEAATPLGVIRMTNVIVAVPGKGPGRIVLGGHYDTKLFREFRFVGANDGGSSTAMLIELARSLKGRQNAFPIDIVFFDGEEALVEWVADDHTYGSRHYVETARRSSTLAGIRAMVLVDMVGDRDLAIRREAQSTRWLTDVIWAAAKRLGYGAHFLAEIEHVEDDHVPFLRAGVPAANLIDLRYASWHTPDDTLDKVSARSLQVVGDTVLAAWPAIEAGASRRSAK